MFSQHAVVCRDIQIACPLEYDIEGDYSFCSTRDSLHARESLNFLCDIVKSLPMVGWQGGLSNMPRVR